MYAESKKDIYGILKVSPLFCKKNYQKNQNKWDTGGMNMIGVLGKTLKVNSTPYLGMLTT